MTFTPCPKPRPALLARRDRVASHVVIDRVERAKCKARSGGQCEARWFGGYGDRVLFRCFRIASENHHLMGGIGRRNIGESVRAEHRIDVCSRCHREITAHVLRPVGEGREDAATVVFERER